MDLLAIVLWSLVFVGVVLFIALATLPLWFQFFKSWAADHRFYWAKLKENSALGLQTNDAMTDMAIRLTPEHYAFMAELYEGHLPFFEEGVLATVGSATDAGVSYEMFVQDPKRYLKQHYRHIGRDGIVFVGHPWFRYRSVRDWAMTPNHRLALNINERTSGAHTIPMTIQTTRFGMLGSQDHGVESNRRAIYEKRMAEVLNDREKRLNPSEEWMLFVLDIPETADGYSVATALEIDWMASAPWELQTKPGRDNVGILLLSHLNAALRQAMKNLEAVEVSKETDGSGTAAKQAIQSRLEEQIWVQLGYNQDGSSSGKWYTKINDADNHTPLAILARNGLLVLRVRVADISLPAELKEALQLAAKARAQMSGDLIRAEAGRQVAEKKKATRQLEGQGEQAYAEAVAKGDRARIGAWSTNEGQVDEAAIVARLQSQGLETYGQAVRDSKSPVIVGAPGAPTDGASMLAGGLAQLGLGLGNRPGSKQGKDKPKSDTKADAGEDGEDS